MIVGELRIGNLLMRRGLVENVFSIKIKFINNTAIREYSGVQLTEDFLLGCGFKKYQGEFQYEYENDFWYSVKHLESSELYHPNVAFDAEQFNQVPLPEIQYVHELQNQYFNVTGKELRLPQL